MAPFGGYYAGKRVLVTGHTGFKGSWLTLWLDSLGAEVVGVGLAPPSAPSHFDACRTGERCRDLRGDIRDYERLAAILAEARPQVVLHLAAQPLVRRAFIDPRETFEVNVMGTVNLLEAARRVDSVEAIVVATSDKAYRNVGWDWGYRETDPLGGHEPYAGSKACAELVVEVYQQQRFQAFAQPPSDVAVASARAGNVVGGGDWAADRLIPDMIRAIAGHQDLTIRNPQATRPWQHVLECLSGYLQLGARLATDRGAYTDGWNFGPADTRAAPVAEIVDRFLARWPGQSTRVTVQPDGAGKEAQALRVDASKAVARLGWQPCWDVETMLDATVDWYARYYREPAAGMQGFSLRQIADYTRAAADRGIGWAAGR